MAKAHAREFQVYPDSDKDFLRPPCEGRTLNLQYPRLLAYYEKYTSFF